MYTLSVIRLNVFYDVGQADIYESAILTLLWFLYVAVLVKNEPLHYWFNARLPCCDELNDTQRAYGVKNKGEFSTEMKFMKNITIEPKGNTNGAGSATVDTDAGDAEKEDATGTIKKDLELEVEASQGPKTIALKNDQSVNKAAAKNTKKSTFDSILKHSMSEYDPADNDRGDGDGNKRGHKISESVSCASHATGASRRKTTKSLIVCHTISRINNGMYEISIFVDVLRTVSALEQAEPSV